MGVLKFSVVKSVPLIPLKSQSCIIKRLRCNCTSLITLSEDEKYYYREIPSFDSTYNSATPGDYYELLGISEEAENDEIKTAFRERQRIAHPDIAGPSAVEISVLLNQAYKTLMDSNLRQQYNTELHLFNELHGVFDGKPMSTWCGSTHEQRAIFVDETTCIGTVMIVRFYINTYRLQELHDVCSGYLCDGGGLGSSTSDKAMG